jgi:hypothetical protein
VDGEAITDIDIIESGATAKERIDSLFRNFPYATDGRYREAAEHIAQDQNKG